MIMPVLDIFKRKKKPITPKKKVPKVKPKVTKKEAKPKKKEKVGKAYRVLIKPLITEKATDLSAQGKYVFKVAKDVTKQEIKKAIEDMYGIRPIAVHNIKVLGKQKRYGRTRGRTPDWKKAVVTLRPGEKIEIVEGV